MWMHVTAMLYESDNFGSINAGLFNILPVLGKPNCLHATWASSSRQKLSHTVPQMLPVHISTRPCVLSPSRSLRAPSTHDVPTTILLRTCTAMGSGYAPWGPHGSNLQSLWGIHIHTIQQVQNNESFYWSADKYCIMGHRLFTRTHDRNITINIKRQFVLCPNIIINYQLSISLPHDTAAESNRVQELQSSSLCVLQSMSLASEPWQITPEVPSHDWVGWPGVSSKILALTEPEPNDHNMYTIINTRPGRKNPYEAN